MNAAIYTRYSSDLQREESTHAQVRICADYAEKQGYFIVKTYSDEETSGKTDKRPAFQQMIKDSQKGLFEVLIVHKVNRFGRNRLDIAIYKKKLADANVKLEYAAFKLTGRPEDVLMESVMGGMAVYYSLDLASEVMKGMKENAYNCKFNGGIPPFGYDVSSDKSYIINDFEAIAIKYIFEAYLNNKTQPQIIEWLNNNGYRTKKGDVFGMNSLNAILKNEKYTGLYVFNKIKSKKSSRIFKKEDEIIKVKDGIPKIIDEEIFKMVQTKMDLNRHVGKSRVSKNEYLLSGVIRCGVCGMAMTGNTRKNSRGTEYSDYQCVGRRKKTCNNSGIKVDDIDDYVCDFISQSLKNNGTKLVDNIYKEVLKNYESINDSKNELENMLDDVKKQLNNIVLAIAQGAYSSILNDKLRELEGKKASLEVSIKEANAPVLTKQDILKFIENLIDIESMEYEKKKRIIQQYVSSVIIGLTDIEICVNIGGSGGLLQLTVTHSAARSLERNKAYHVTIGVVKQ
jgi:site-specific DNA recombinase